MIALFPVYPERRELYVTQSEAFIARFTWYDGDDTKWDDVPVGIAGKFQVRQLAQITSPAIVSITETSGADGQVTFAEGGVVQVNLTPAATVSVTDMDYALYGLSVTLPDADPFPLAQGKYWFNRTVVY